MLPIPLLNEGCCRDAENTHAILGTKIMDFNENGGVEVDVLRTPEGDQIVVTDQVLRLKTAANFFSEAMEICQHCSFQDTIYDQKCFNAGTFAFLVGTML